MTDSSARLEIKQVNEHLKNYTIIHELLSELEATSSSAQDSVDLSQAVGRWVQMNQATVIVKNSLADGSPSIGTPLRVSVPTTFASTVLQLLVELNSVAVRGGHVLQEVCFEPLATFNGSISSCIAQVALSFDGLGSLEVARGMEDTLLSALIAAVCESPLKISNTGQASSLVTVRIGNSVASVD